MKNPIDYSSPSHHLDEILFEVKMQEVFSGFKFPDENKVTPVLSKNHLAIVNQENGEILSVVGRNYKLIKNIEAIEMGKHIFKEIFPQIKTDELIPYKVVAPASKGSAHIDLISKKVNFDVWQQETWLPFLRVSNSYNRTHALSFEIGFVRRLCSNGVLFNKKTMKIKYYHVKDRQLHIKNDTEGIKSETDLFVRHCNILSKITVPKETMFPLACKILNVNLNPPDRRNLLKKMQQLSTFKETVDKLTPIYVKDLGENAYAALSTVTDVVSHQNAHKIFPGFYLNVRTYYARPTDWMNDFVRLNNGGGFELDGYLKTIFDDLDKLKTTIGFDWREN